METVVIEELPSSEVAPVPPLMESKEEGIEPEEKLVPEHDEHDALPRSPK
jgi:hypothetical protein